MRRFTVVFDGALDGKRLADFNINGATSVAYYDGDAYVCFQDFIAEIADLNAEIKRLREALEKIAKHDMQAIAMDALHPNTRIRAAHAEKENNS